MKNIRLLLATAVGLGVAYTEPAAADEGAELAFKYRCMTCHGVAGKSNTARYPNLAGQHAAYLEARLKYFRSGAERNNPMNGQAAPLTEAEIAAVARYFAEQGS